jgi:hypothetical protein
LFLKKGLDAQLLTDASMFTYNCPSYIILAIAKSSGGPP